MTKQNITGLLLFDKPQGITSNTALQKVKRLFKAKKAGHTGTLDPLATGLLPICLGEATKFSQFLLNSNKSYTVTAKLGAFTDTGDSDGSVIEELPIPTLTSEIIENTLSKFIGEIEQVPPMYSALKHQGVPLYKLAREGKDVTRKARQVVINSIELESYDDQLLTLHVSCSKGTYIRTLIEDIAKSLETAAHVTVLRRTEVGELSLEDAKTLSELEDEPCLSGCLVAIDKVLVQYPEVKLDKLNTEKIRYGQAIQCKGNAGLVRLYSELDVFLGIGEILDDHTLRVKRLMSTD